jgi:hypothetical protein
MRHWLESASEACSDLEAFIGCLEKLFLRLALFALTLFGLYHFVVALC